MLRAALFWPGLVVSTAVLGLLSILTGPFDRRGRVIQRYSRLWGRTALRLAGARAVLARAAPVAGGAAAPTGGGVFVANHQSTVDIFVLAAVLPGQLRWVVKRELFRIPILGSAMRAAGYVSIDREGPVRSRAGLSRGAAALADGASLVVFPEGTRSADGRLRPFKRGAFALAQGSGAPVVPVALIGSRDVLAAGAYRIRPGTVRVVVGAPIPSGGLSQAQLAARARAAVAEMLGAAPGPASAPVVAAAAPSPGRRG